MERGSGAGNGLAFVVTVSYVSTLLLLVGAPLIDAYHNYTVGDSLGWYDSSEKPSINYQKWASGKNFSLGDFLIFNTNNNHSVVQTYNLTTYKACDYADALDNDTIQWSSADPSNTETQPVTVAVPLVKEGTNCFFSGDYDGDQCKNGQHFKIDVAHGQGLPASLKNPSDEAPAPVSPADSGSDNSVPDTVIPSNFNNPQNITNESQASASGTDAFVDYMVVIVAGVIVRIMMS